MEYFLFLHAVCIFSICAGTRLRRSTNEELLEGSESSYRFNVTAVSWYEAAKICARDVTSLLSLVTAAEKVHLDKHVASRPYENTDGADSLPSAGNQRSPDIDAWNRGNRPLLRAFWAAKQPVGYVISPEEDVMITSRRLRWLKWKAFMSTVETNTLPRRSLSEFNDTSATCEWLSVPYRRCFLDERPSILPAE